MYTVFWIAGEKDGEIIGNFETEWQAVLFARDYYNQHENEFDESFGGVGICDPDGNELVNW